MPSGQEQDRRQRLAAWLALLPLRFGGHAPAQRVHDVDHVARRRRGRRLGPGGRDVLSLVVDDLDQPLLHRIADHFWAPGLLALLDQLRDEIEQGGVGLRFPNAAKEFAGVAHVGAVAQRPELDAVVARLEQHRALAPMEDEAGYADHAGRAHRVANDAVGLFAYLVVRREIIGSVVPDPVDAVGRSEGLDVDGARAFEPNRLKLLVLEQDIRALVAGVALDLLVFLHRLSGRAVDVAADDPISRFAVERMEADLVGVARGGCQGDRTGYERKLQIAFPERTRRHRKLPLFCALFRARLPLAGARRLFGRGLRGLRPGRPRLLLWRRFGRLGLGGPLRFFGRLDGLPLRGVGRALDGRFGRLDGRFGRLDGRFGRLDRRFGRLDRRFGRLLDGGFGRGLISGVFAFGDLRLELRLSHEPKPVRVALALRSSFLLPQVVRDFSNASIAIGHCRPPSHRIRALLSA